LHTMVFICDILGGSLVRIPQEQKLYHPFSKICSSVGFITWLQFMHGNP
jgi:hypothetical protein